MEDLFEEGCFPEGEILEHPRDFNSYRVRDVRGLNGSSSCCLLLRSISIDDNNISINRRPVFSTCGDREISVLRTVPGLVPCRRKIVFSDAAQHNLQVLTTEPLSISEGWPPAEQLRELWYFCIFFVPAVTLPEIGDSRASARFYQHQGGMPGTFP